MQTNEPAKEDSSGSEMGYSEHQEPEECERCDSRLIGFEQYYAEIEYPPEVDGDGWFSGAFCRECVIGLEEAIREHMEAER